MKKRTKITTLLAKALVCVFVLCTLATPSLGAELETNEPTNFTTESQEELINTVDLNQADSLTQAEAASGEEAASDEEVTSGEEAASGEEVTSDEEAASDEEITSDEEMLPNENNTPATRAGTIQITNISDIQSIFTDPTFCSVVFDAVKNGQDGAVGTDIEDALANFQGIISYDRQSSSTSTPIRDITGILTLKKANKISLQHNEISDFTLFDGISSTHFGLTAAEYANLPDTTSREATTNVLLDLGGNPIEKLPSIFGGRLSIAQPGSTSYMYSTPADGSLTFTYIRPDTAVTITGTVPIEKMTIKNADGTTSSASLVSVNRSLIKSKGDIESYLKITNHTSQNADFEIKKTGTTHIAIGTNQELRYYTTDEFETETTGSQSHKYYLQPSFLVYDKVSAKASYNGSALLSKTDADTGKPLQGAVFSVYNKADDSLIEANLTSDKKGEVVVHGLHDGEYYFVETAAPKGYKLNSDKIPFTVEIVDTTTLPHVTVAGGLSEIETSNGDTVTAQANEVLIAGADKTGSSPDVTLSAQLEEDIETVKVTYSNLETYLDEATGTNYPTNSEFTENVVRKFTTIAEAQADINNEKNNNTICGPVSVQVHYGDASNPPVKVSATNKAIETPPTEQPSETPSTEPSEAPPTEPSKAPPTEPSSTPSTGGSVSPEKSQKPSTPSTGDSSPAVPLTITLCLAAATLLLLVKRSHQE